ncbi:hypothetical protein [Xanthomonas hortorum]|uniref:hypothetical protein n=1 Tax=Xanthomonas hortorum TaxID=56454 RepID=UPI0029356598|nr:hypothetical protein [Xanthomonas hortorum]MDV2453611.1 hypothetical protein [Xanthomonas hortorum NBC5720]
MSVFDAALSAIDDQRLPGNESGIARPQKEYLPENVLGLAMRWIAFVCYAERRYSSPCATVAGVSVSLASAALQVMPPLIVSLANSRMSCMVSRAQTDGLNPSVGT